MASIVFLLFDGLVKIEDKYTNTHSMHRQREGEGSHAPPREDGKNDPKARLRRTKSTTTRLHLGTAADVLQQQI